MTKDFRWGVQESQPVLSRSPRSRMQVRGADALVRHAYGQRTGLVVTRRSSMSLT